MMLTEPPSTNYSLSTYVSRNSVSLGVAIFSLLFSGSGFMQSKRGCSLCHIVNSTCSDSKFDMAFTESSLRFVIYYEPTQTISLKANLLLISTYLPHNTNYHQPPHFMARQWWQQTGPLTSRQLFLSITLSSNMFSIVSDDMSALTDIFFLIEKILWHVLLISYDLKIVLQLMNVTQCSCM